MKKLSKKEWIAIIVAVVLVGYSLFGGNIMSLFQKNDVTGNSLAAVANLDSDLNTKNNKGVTIKDIVVGKGPEIKNGQSVFVNYVLSLLDGTVIQNSKDFGQPFKFTLGTGDVISGWELGLEGMRVGGMRTIIIPPELAYGKNQVGPIPANSTLIFTIELVDVQ